MRKTLGIRKMRDMRVQDGRKNKNKKSKKSNDNYMSVLNYVQVTTKLSKSQTS